MKPDRRRTRSAPSQPQLTLATAERIPTAVADAAGHRTLQGDVEAVFAQSDDGGWLAGSLRVQGWSQPVRFAGGALAGVWVGCSVDLVGYWEVHPEHGTQFRAERCTRSLLPRERDGLVKYLVANLDHIGPASAGRIVDRFGERTLDVLGANPEEVFGLWSGRQAERIAESIRAWSDRCEEERWAHHTAPRLMMAGDIGYPMARRIARFFAGAEVADLIARRDPYRLLEVPGIGWRTADRISLSMGVPKEDERREEAALGWALDAAMQRKGHSALPQADLLRAGARLLGRPEPSGLDAALERSIATASIVSSAGLLYRPRVLRAEWDVAEAFSELSRRVVSLPAPERRRVGTIARRQGLSEPQERALVQALERGLSVLTGRPGTGKTHTLRALVEACAAAGRRVVVAAPTGKAAARAAEVTRTRACTLHKLLGGPPGGLRRDGPVSGCVLVVDEASMVDLETAAWLANNLDLDSDLRVVLVGDADQLPSVGHGNVLADVLTSGVPSVSLTEIRRQAEGSSITRNAHALLDGRDLCLGESDDFLFVEAPGGTGDTALRRTHELVLGAVRRIIRDERGSVLRRAGREPRFDPARELQVLSPRNSGLLGVDALNESLQRIFNPGRPEGPRISGRAVHVGDRVVSVRNDYTVEPDGLMNGEQGVVQAIDGDRLRLRLDDGREITTAGPQNYLLAHAFCSTVHRSQGSEYPFLVVCYHSSHFPVLDVRVLYTALTRGRRRVVLVSDRDALRITRELGAGGERFTGLTRHIADA